MKNRISQKEVSEGLHTYGKVSWVGGSGKQFVIGYNWQKDGFGFQFLFFAYGRKPIVAKRIKEILNTRTDTEIAELRYVNQNAKIPISLKGGIGLNCF